VHRLILRNYLAQQAIEQAEQLDYTEVRRLFAELQHPYDSSNATDISLSQSNETCSLVHDLLSTVNVDRQGNYGFCYSIGNDSI
jgi:uncharacterized protein YdiU (UPF0061 family)